MKFKRNIFFYCFLLLEIILFSCKKEDNVYHNQNLNVIYPLAVGNEWDYTRSIIITYFDSIKTDSVIKLDTMNEQYFVKVESIDTLHDSLLTYRFLSFEKRRQIRSYHWYSNSREGLFSHAYITDGSIILPRRKKNTVEYYNRLFIFLSNGFFEQSSIVFDTIYYEKPNAIILKYPLKKNLKWTLRSNPNFVVYKEVLGYENVHISLGNFNCYKIKYSWSDSTTINWTGYEWVGTVGIVKRTFNTGKINMTGDNGEMINLAEIQETQELTRYLLQ